MGVSHGMNDAQKTMGIIALALLTGTTSGAFDHLPGWLSFLHTAATGRRPAPAHRQVDRRTVRVDDVRRHGGGRLAHHQDPRP